MAAEAIKGRRRWVLTNYNLLSDVTNLVRCLEYNTHLENMLTSATYKIIAMPEISFSMAKQLYLSASTNPPDLADIDLTTQAHIGTSLEPESGNPA